MTGKVVFEVESLPGDWYRVESWDKSTDEWVFEGNFTDIYEAKNHAEDLFRVQGDRTRVIEKGGSDE